ncbi:helix-turn-helix domain-containing protein [Paenibacillus larvae]|uniref:Helix-turn-helix domain-containing protein n=1 Tax=Paenibacillus larvae subsp. larvae DSM 25430 TaxID=697284 RepID=V9W117_9BACL|nr:helix-turn-helix domain-containing protein [Paenibacillus larvae]AHD04681.1 hypothetical protein ERIC2_c08480 [Paenibacillus larvae subsp. larvae DSM 25430]MDR5566985.1 helix-turn-helix domain-containing protein [Paenibacillus larvae]MDR5595019.1 helix-turn-helix domain-containing protein [Paenibacillus larvae]
MTKSSALIEVLDTIVERVATQIQPEIVKRLSFELPVTRDKILDVQEVAEQLGVSVKTLYDMCKKKKIPHRRVGTRILFSSSALDAWGREQDKKNYQPN